MYELRTGHPEREAGELVCVADLTGELRAWPRDTWANLGVDPQVAAGAVLAAWRGGDLTGLLVAELAGEEAMALARRPWSWRASSSASGSPARSAGAYRRWLHPTSGRRPGDRFQ